MKKLIAIPLQIIGLSFPLVIFYFLRHIADLTMFLKDIQYVFPVAGMILFTTAYITFLFYEQTQNDTTFFTAITVGVYVTLLTIPIMYASIAAEDLIQQYMSKPPLKYFESPGIMLFLESVMTSCGILWIVMNAEEYIIDNDLPKITSWIFICCEFICALIAMAYIFRYDIPWKFFI